MAGKAKDPEKHGGQDDKGDAAKLRKGDKVTRGGQVVGRTSRKPDTTDGGRVKRDDPPGVTGGSGKRR